MTSTGDINTVTLAGGTANEVVINAPSNSTCDFEDSGAGDVNWTGADTITVVDSFNQGTPLTGHVMSIACERQTIANGEYGSWGAGVNDGASGICMPTDGSIVSITLGTSASSTGTFEVYINNTGTGVTLSVSGSSSDIDSSPGISFSQNDFIGVLCTAGSDAGTSWFFTLFLRLEI
jgi:hypothetical protein